MKDFFNKLLKSDKVIMCENDIKNIRIIESFAEVSKCGLMAFNTSGNIILSQNSCSCDCFVAKKSPTVAPLPKQCAELHCHSGKQSELFGGKYIYYCPSGFVFVACLMKTNSCASAKTSEASEAESKQAVFENHQLRRDDTRKQNVCIVAGPMNPVEFSDFDVDELASSCEIDTKDAELLEFIKSVPFFKPESISNVAVLFHFCISRLAEENAGTLQEDVKSGEIYEQQREISEYIQDIKAKLIKDTQTYISYPYEKEKKLVYAITANDLTTSRKYLNEILGHIFFSSANDLDIIKVRAMELSVMISRAALDAGADQAKISDINVKFLGEFFNYKTIEEVCWALTDILKKFTKETFEFSNVKNVELISKAVSYIKTNYWRKITLSEVASFVFLSPSYFSKIFKHEMDFYFNDYLNYVRIQKSKLLLLTERMTLVEIADQVGFYDQSYFNKVFKKITGITPKKFRETNGRIADKPATYDK